MRTRNLFALLIFVATFVLLSLPASALPRKSATSSLTATTGTVTLTKWYFDSELLTYTLNWTSSNAGNATATTTDAGVYGTIERVIFVPGSGADAPTADYDVTVKDEDGYDILRGGGANLSGTAVKSYTPLDGDGATTATKLAVNGPLTLAVTNAGDANTGKVRITVRR